MAEENKKLDFESMFSGLGRKIDELVGKGAEKGDEMKEEFGERFEALKNSRDDIESKIKDLKDSDKLKEVGSQLEKAGQEFKKAIEILFKGEDTPESESSEEVVVTESEASEVESTEVDVETDTTDTEETKA